MIPKLFDYAAAACGPVQADLQIPDQARWGRRAMATVAVVTRFLLWAVCPYDTRVFSRRVVQDASRTRPMLWKTDRPEASPAIVDPAALLRKVPSPSRPG